MIEDACQAHGASRDGVVPGALSDGAAFSFYPGKNLGAMGDGGALATVDPEVDERMRALREHGQREKYRHHLVGYTSRLDTIQALILLRKLPQLRAWTAQRRQAAALYGELLAGVGDLVLPPVAPGSRPVWHLYVVRTADPGALGAFLGERGVGTGRHYPEPPHLSQAFARLGHGRGAFPVSERLADAGHLAAALRRDHRGRAVSAWPRSCAPTSVADAPANDAPYRLIADVVFGERVVVRPFTNLYGCAIGDDTTVGPFVEIQRGVRGRRALQALEPRVPLHRRRARGRGLRRPRRRVHQRQAAVRDDRGRAAAERGRLGAR